MYRICVVVVMASVLLFTAFNSSARIYDLPKGDDRLIGEPTIHVVKKGDFFQALAEKYDVGFLAMLAANPNVDPFLPPEGTKLNIPTQMILPYGERKGIIINLPELRLYYFPPNENKVHVFPVGIGREGLETPRTTSYISEKRKNPIWRPTKEMKARYLEEQNIVLPDEVPPGPDNPFGKYALRLGTSEYLIHGSNQRFGIGMRASSGCIRMFSPDIKWLYENVPSKTVVKIIEQPVKMAQLANGQKFIEMHRPLSIEGEVTPELEINSAIINFISGNPDNLRSVYLEKAKPKGLVIDILPKMESSEAMTVNTENSTMNNIENESTTIDRQMEESEPEDVETEKTKVENLTVDGA